MSDNAEIFKIPEEAQRFARYDVLVWLLADGVTWVARPDQYPMLEARSLSRHHAILGCIDMIEREYRDDEDERAAFPVEKRRYQQQTETGTEAVTQVQTWTIEP